MDRTIGQHMSSRLNAIDPQSVEQSPFVARRKLAQHVSTRGINIRLVECHPDPAQVANRARYLAREALKKPGSILPEKCASLLKPSADG